MQKKKTYFILTAGIVIGVLVSGIGIKLVSKVASNSQQSEQAEEYAEDPLWVLSDEEVALSDGSHLETETETTQNSEEGYTCSINGAKIRMDSPALPVIAKLGTPNSYSETSNCLYGDLDKTYQYAGFEISTYSVGDIDYIAAVFISDNTITTPEGMSVAMTMDKMEQAYGMSYVKENDICAYEKDGTGLEFIYDNDTVLYIQYLSANYM